MLTRCPAGPGALLLLDTWSEASPNHFVTSGNGWWPKTGECMCGNGVVCSLWKRDKLRDNWIASAFHPLYLLPVTAASVYLTTELASRNNLPVKSAGCLMLISFMESSLLEKNFASKTSLDMQIVTLEKILLSILFCKGTIFTHWAVSS